MRLLIVYSGFALLTACCMPTATGSNCLPLKPWSTAEQLEAANDLGGIPADHAIQGMFEDYRSLRRATKACQRVAGSHNNNGV